MPSRGGTAPLFSLRLSLCTSAREEEEEEALEPPETLNPKPRGLQKSRSHTGLERQDHNRREELLGIAAPSSSLLAAAAPASKSITEVESVAHSSSTEEIGSIFLSLTGNCKLPSLF